MSGSLVFVHGTGVRLASFEASFDRAAAQAKAAGITAQLVECAWGDPLGVVFAGKSLPDEPSAQAAAAAQQEVAAWSWLFDDPLAELEQLSIRGTNSRRLGDPGKRPDWEIALKTLNDYRPSLEASLLLQRAGLDDLWRESHGFIAASPITAIAFERSEEAGELADARLAYARAVIARLHGAAVARGRPGTDATARSALFARLEHDWSLRVFGLGTLLANFGKRAGTGILARHRNAFNAAIAQPIGDILLYQAHGEQIRRFIAEKIAAAVPPVTVVAHSLGGIASFELAAQAGDHGIDRLVTIGSQAPYFFELGALACLQGQAELPAAFPKWLNIFDRGDFLSFVGGRLFPGRVTDFDAELRTAFPDSHSAYIGSPRVWSQIAGFIA